jgi:hypothetical protein
MTVAGAPKFSPRWEQAEVSRLAWAFAISLALHLVIFGGYAAGKRFGWWEEARWPAWLKPVKTLVELLKKKDLAQLQPRAREVPLIFVDVSPAQVTAEPPKNTKFYSDKNSQAANPQADKDDNIPKITGTQTEVPKTEDVPRQKFFPLQPSLPAPTAHEDQAEERAKPVPPPGDLALAKPDLTPRPDQGQAEHTRPRTIKEALARQQDNQVPGQKLRQDGGVSRHLDIASMDVAASPFGAYDKALIDAVRRRWFALLDERNYTSDARGKVVVHFRLHYDGRVSEIEEGENSAGEVLGLICQKAIRDPAPFAAWPMDMRLEMGETRDVQFTFFYN